MSTTLHSLVDITESISSRDNISKQQMYQNLRFIFIIIALIRMERLRIFNNWKSKPTFSNKWIKPFIGPWFTKQMLIKLKRIPLKEWNGFRNQKLQKDLSLNIQYQPNQWKTPHGKNNPYNSVKRWQCGKDLKRKTNSWQLGRNKILQSSQSWKDVLLSSIKSKSKPWKRLLGDSNQKGSEN